MITSTYKYYIGALMLAAASVASADNFTGMAGEKDGMIWTLDGAVSGRYVGTGVVLSQGADILSWNAVSGIESVLSGRVDEKSIYPNPVFDSLHVQGAGDDACWCIITIDGRLVATGDVKDNLIDCSGIAAGRYVVTIANRNGSAPYSSIIIKK